VTRVALLDSPSGGELAFFAEGQRARIEKTLNHSSLSLLFIEVHFLRQDSMKRRDKEEG
jgi:hypothetical protein